MPRFASSEHQVLFQKIGFYAATVQYQQVVIPIPLQETIDSLVAMSDELGKYQQDQNKSGNAMAAINGHHQSSKNKNGQSGQPHLRHN